MYSCLGALGDDLSEAMGFCPPLRMGYFQGRTVNLPEAMCLDFHLLVDYVIHEYP